MHSFLSPIPCLPFVWKQWTRRDRPSEDWGSGSTTKLTPEAIQHPQCFAVMHLAQEKTWMVRWLVAVAGVLPPQRSSPQIPCSPGPPLLCPPSSLHRGKCYLITRAEGKWARGSGTANETQPWRHQTGNVNVRIRRFPEGCADLAPSPR